MCSAWHYRGTEHSAVTRQLQEMQKQCSNHASAPSCCKALCVSCVPIVCAFIVGTARSCSFSGSMLISKALLHFNPLVVFACYRPYGYPPAGMPPRGLPPPGYPYAPPGMPPPGISSAQLQMSLSPALPAKIFCSSSLHNLDQTHIVNAGCHNCIHCL